MDGVGEVWAQCAEQVTATALWIIHIFCSSG